MNQLIGVINMSLSRGEHRGDQTIQQFIGSHLTEDDQTRPLEEYLGQINTAFLASHEAIKKAAHAMVAQVLDNLSPHQVAGQRGTRMKIGPLRNAEDFDILSEKIQYIRKWFDSGRFVNDFLSEFERHCETMNKNQR